MRKNGRGERTSGSPPEVCGRSPTRTTALAAAEVTSSAGRKGAARSRMRRTISGSPEVSNPAGSLELRPMPLLLCRTYRMCMQNGDAPSCYEFRAASCAVRTMHARARFKECAGDIFLQMASGRRRNSIRKYDRGARINGDVGTPRTCPAGGHRWRRWWR